MAIDICFHWVSVLTARNSVPVIFTRDHIQMISESPHPWPKIVNIGWLWGLCLHCMKLGQSIVDVVFQSLWCWIWWRHQMETFSALLAICALNSAVSGEFLAQRPVTRSFGVFFDLRLNKRLSKQSWGWWFETLSRPLWRHCNKTQNIPR